MGLQRGILVLDFNSPWCFGRFWSTLRWKGDADARGEADFLAVDGLHSQAGLRRMREAISRQLSREGVLLPRPVPRDDLCAVDQTIVLQGPKTSHFYPTPLRRVAYDDSEHERRLVFLTNNFELPALTIAQLYRCRW